MCPSHSHRDPADPQQGRGITPERLQEHADSVRALARRLLADEHAAEDVVQDTWVVALERPPRHTEALAGWLRSVARSLVHKTVRGSERRERRERTAARDEGAASPSETLDAEERVATLRHVTDAVLSLSEPYRGTVLQRYFENLPPREIAQREGVSVATVKSRLQRGLERLRLGLTEKEGPGWRRDLAAFVGMALPALPPLQPGSGPRPHAPRATTEATAAPTSGGFPMAGIGKLVLGALLLTMAATAVWRWVKPDANASPRLASALERGLESAAEVSEAKGALSDPTQDSARVALSDRRGGAQDPAASSAAARATEVRLEVSVRDPFGLPVPHATVFAAPLGQAINRIGTTDARGQLAFSWEDETGRTELALAIRGPLGGADILERMTLAAGHENRVERVVEKPMETNVLYADGTFVSLGRFLPFGDPLERAPQALLGEKGRLQFVKETKPLHDHVIQPDLSLDLDFGLPRAEDIVLESELEYVEHQAHAVRGEYAILEIAPPIHVTGHDATLIIETLPADTSAEERPVMGVAKGWVRDADGRPAVHTPVAILTPEGGLLQRRPTDEEGAFHFDGLPDGEYVLRAGGDRNGLASTTFQAHEGRAFQWTGELVRGPQIEGRLTLEGAGTEIPTWEGWSLCASAEEAGIQRQAAASIADDGRFAFPESLGTAATLSVIPPDQSHPIPMTSQRVFAGSTDPISIDPREARPASLSLRVHDEEGVRPRERPRAAVARRLSARHLGPAGRGRERGHGRRVPLLEPARRVLPHRNRRSRTPVADATPTMGRGRGDHRPGPLRAATGGGIGVLRGRDRGMIQN